MPSATGAGPPESTYGPSVGRTYGRAVSSASISGRQRRPSAECTSNSETISPMSVSGLTSCTAREQADDAALQVVLEIQPRLARRVRRVGEDGANELRAVP